MDRPVGRDHQAHDPGGEVPPGTAAGIRMVLPSSVTAPARRASSRPSTEALRQARWRPARGSFRMNTEFVPSVAELPTCQVMFSACRRRARDDLATDRGGERGGHLKDEHRVGVPLGVERQVTRRESPARTWTCKRRGTSVMPPRFPASNTAPAVCPATASSQSRSPGKLSLGGSQGRPRESSR